jgi:hypothetical protein
MPGIKCLEETVRPLKRMDEAIDSGNLSPSEVNNLRSWGVIYSFSILGVEWYAKFLEYGLKCGSVVLSGVAGVNAVGAFEEPAHIPIAGAAAIGAGVCYLISKKTQPYVKIGEECKLECKSEMEQIIEKAALQPRLF